MSSAEPLAPVSMPVLGPDVSFDAASRLVLDYLSQHLPLAMWGVSRVENGRQTFLSVTAGNGYGAVPGDTGPWDDSFCIRMYGGRGPTVAPDAQSVPAYAEAPANDSKKIGCYAGAPITEPAGDLFGVICGIDPDRRVEDGALAQAAPLLSLFGQLLTMALAAERARDRAATAVLEATLVAETDVLTGLYNRRAWDRVLEEEERRFHRLGDPTVAVVLDLDLLKVINDTQGHAAGDRHLQRAGDALRRSVKGRDTVARLGGDEFGILLRGCTEAEATGAVDRVHLALTAAGVAGSIGWAPITVMNGLPVALAEADAAMYVAKAARRAARAAPAIA